MIGGLNQVRMVGERSVGLRRCSVRDAGGIRSANADMSSDKGSENLPRRIEQFVVLPMNRQATTLGFLL